MSAENEVNIQKDFPEADRGLGFGGCGAGTPVLPYGVKIETADGSVGMIINHRIEDIKKYMREGPNAKIKFIVDLESNNQGILLHPKDIRAVLGKTSITMRK